MPAANKPIINAAGQIITKCPGCGVIITCNGAPVNPRHKRTCRNRRDRSVAATGWTAGKHSRH